MRYQHKIETRKVLARQLVIEAHHRPMPAFDSAAAKKDPSPLRPLRPRPSHSNGEWLFMVLSPRTAHRQLRFGPKRAEICFRD